MRAPIREMVQEEGRIRRWAQIQEMEGRYLLADKALEKLKDRVREITSRTRGRRLGDIIAELREPLLWLESVFRYCRSAEPSA